jgi:hypothetical protein
MKDLNSLYASVRMIAHFLRRCIKTDSQEICSPSLNAESNIRIRSVVGEDNDAFF